MPGGLLTDLYELNMAVSYLRRGMTGPAAFSLFVRRQPPDRGFLIVAGLEDCLAFLEQFAFTADLEWQGVEAGLAVAHASAIAGFAATSNTEAARRYGLTAASTMAHAWPGGRQAGLRGPGRAGGAGPQPAG
jgi:nicotinate phosphoribosyltransferase